MTRAIALTLTATFFVACTSAEPGVDTDAQGETHLGPRDLGGCTVTESYDFDGDELPDQRLERRYRPDGVVELEERADQAADYLYRYEATWDGACLTGAVEYTARGELEEIVSIEQRCDGFGDPEQIAVRRQQLYDGDPDIDVSWSWTRTEAERDAADRIVADTWFVAEGIVNRILHSTYTYDAAGRLVALERLENGLPHQSERWTLAADGRWLTWYLDQEGEITEGERTLDVHGRQTRLEITYPTHTTTQIDEWAPDRNVLTRTEHARDGEILTAVDWFCADAQGDDCEVLGDGWAPIATGELRVDGLYDWTGSIRFSCPD